jgi:hypothetical protein
MSSHGLERVSFRFESDSEVRSLAHTPTRGDRVLHGGKLWVISYVVTDDLGRFVGCVRPPQHP